MFILRSIFSKAEGKKERVMRKQGMEKQSQDFFFLFFLRLTVKEESEETKLLRSKLQKGHVRVCLMKCSICGR